MDPVYNMCMKLLFIVPILALTLSGCAVTTGMSVVSLATTGKTIGDHATSQITSSDCDGVRTLTHGSYYCELRDIGKTYNRSGY